MAETAMMCRTRSDASVAGVAETLRAQQQLLQKLYAELDDEREASAIAAREAMDMILRLQGEKAVVDMEASQFKRMAEEKMDHAEATLEAYDELLYEKETEIASLKFQLQAYKDKLVSLGCDFNVSEFQYVRSNSNDQISSTDMTRLKSIPPIPFKKILTLRESLARKSERSPNPTPVSGDQEPSLLCGSETLDSYWNKIKMLHEQVKLISHCKNVGAKSCECGQTHKLKSTNSDEVVNHGESTRDSKAFSDHRGLANVHDVFEVPQATRKHEGRSRLGKWNSVADIRLTKPDSVSEAMVESYFKHDAERKNGKATIIGKKKERMGVDSNSQTEVHQKVAKLQRQRTSRRYDEITRDFESGDGEEQLRLLKDIKTELKLIQSEMKILKTKNVTHVDDAVSFGLLQEEKYIESGV
ncbi:myosin-binding protein [Trifolium repens]|nr:myosin-binding protein [Trifolium repens]